MIFLSICFIIFLMSLVLKVSWWIIKFAGKLIGFLLGSIGFLLVGTFAISVVGLAFVFLPIIIILGICALVGMLAKAF